MDLRSNWQWKGTPYSPQLTIKCSLESQPAYPFSLVRGITLLHGTQSDYSKPRWQSVISRFLFYIGTLFINCTLLILLEVKYYIH